jgi:hypothetical protein
MATEYDIFERTPTGYLVWRDVVYGYENAVNRLCQLALKSDNEHFVFHLASKQVVARVNEAPARRDLRASPAATDEADASDSLMPFGMQRDRRRSAA